MQIKNKLGFNIDIEEIIQYKTYSGVMLGETENVNKHILSNIKKCYQPEKFNEIPFYITNIKRYTNDYKKELPNVATCAFLTTMQTINTKIGLYSGLVVFWFQDDYFQKPEDEILQEIQNLDWIKFCKELEWD